MWRYWKPWLTDFLFNLLPQGRYYKKLIKELDGFTDKVIYCRKEILRNAKVTVEDGKKKRSSFMDLVLDATENKHICSDSDLKAMVNTFIFAVSRNVVFRDSLSKCDVCRALKQRETH